MCLKAFHLTFLALANILFVLKGLSQFGAGKPIQAMTIILWVFGISDLNIHSESSIYFYTHTNTFFFFFFFFYISSHNNHQHMVGVDVICIQRRTKDKKTGLVYAGFTSLLVSDKQALLTFCMGMFSIRYCLVLQYISMTLLHINRFNLRW